MSADRLVIFDVDGTLVDSQAAIVASMHAAFAAVDIPPPPRSELLSVVGLSLPIALARLLPEKVDMARAVAAYKAAFHSQHLTDTAPLFPGTRQMLTDLAARPGMVLGVATGKGRAGLMRLLEDHQISAHFSTFQVADDHPSKPDPSMITAALAETGLDASAAIMVGDTTFDIDMARAASVPGIGVSWGYHHPSVLRQAGAARVIDSFAQLGGVLEDLWGQPT